MCELFGASAAKAIKLNSYLKTFYSHGRQHPHGWGLALFNNKAAEIKKGKESAENSPYLKERLESPIEAETCLAHIRYATIGNIEYVNCHPYSKKDNSGRTYTLIHNGTIFDYPKLNKYINYQFGETDSERILLYILEVINIKQKQLNRALNGAERFNTLNDIITDMSKGNKLNLIIYDDEYVYVHTNYKNSLYYLTKDNATLFSTTPLSDEEWKNVPFTTLLAYKDGELKFKGTPHNSEYIQNDESVKLLYQIFSNL